MPAPLIYTEPQLAAYMHTALRGTAADLDWSAPPADGTGVYAEIVTDTLLAYGVDTIAAATDIQKLRLLATREVWRAVMAETATWTNISGTDGAKDDRAAIYAAAKGMYAQASQAVTDYLATLPTPPPATVRRAETVSVPVVQGW